MNRQQRPDSGGLAVVEAPYRRQDVRQRDIVNHAISVQESSNTMCAIEYLKAQEIHPDVIERVLLEPQRRREMLAH
ncbi:hypothetical protein PO883_12615 [Massilia sp. DJPM01]|uniref:hypothetical protein n=1 Tax=Massilia sp. DJPM01 TaxID=3024404 RepID=UPI00259DD5FB|nr:hypothetical protein [Massilia sp. DJPM01]MDM5178034.1 hypothetical protein [Massilia sp. DJPM01]